MHRVLIAATLALVGVAFATLTPAPSNAQYPPPEGSGVALVVEDVAPAVGNTVSIGATVLDPSGNPVVGAECTFTITSEPGTDASVSAGPATTNEDGVATALLYVGSTEGEIIVEANCGEVVAEISVVAGAAEAPEEPAAPPGSLPDQLVDAGYGPSATSGGLDSFFLGGLIITLLAALGALELVRRAWFSGSQA